MKLGPYRPVAESDYAPWSKGDADTEAEMNAWYARSRIGDRYNDT